MREYQDRHEVNPDNISAFDMGGCYYTLGDYPRALQALNQVLAIEPNDVLARHNVNVVFAGWCSQAQPYREMGQQQRGVNGVLMGNSGAVPASCVSNVALVLGPLRPVVLRPIGR